MTLPVKERVLFCDDCTLFHCNGDLPEDENRAVEVEAAFDTLTQADLRPALNQYPSGLGVVGCEPCECCGTEREGPRTFFALFATKHAHDMRCGTCDRTWSSVDTPCPAGRCPFENDHEPDPELVAGDLVARQVQRGIVHLTSDGDVVSNTRDEEEEA